MSTEQLNVSECLAKSVVAICWSNTPTPSHIVSAF